MVIEFWQKPHRRGRIFYRGQCFVTPTSPEHFNCLLQSRCIAVNEDWGFNYPLRCMLLLTTEWPLFAAYTATETSNAFQCAGQLQNSPFPCGILTPSNNGLLSPHESAPNSILIGLSVFAQLICVPRTQTHTHRQTHRPLYMRHL